MNAKKKLFYYLFAAVVSAILIFIDQFTKLLVLNNLSGGHEIVIWEGVFKIVSHKNTGAVWGIMSDKTTFLAVITVVILAAVVWIFARIPLDETRFRPVRIILIFVFSGAIGNFIDRVRLKYVVDFLYFELIDFPVFNIADCYITLSMILLIILFIFYYKDEDFDYLWHRKSN